MLVTFINRLCQSGFAVVGLIVCIVLYVGASNIVVSVNGVNATLLATISTSFSVAINAVRETTMSVANSPGVDPLQCLEGSNPDALAALSRAISVLGLNSIAFSNLTVSTQTGAIVFPVVASAVTICSHFWLYLVTSLGLVETIIDVSRIKDGNFYGLSNSQVVYVCTLSLSDAICAILWFISALYLAIAYGSWNCGVTARLLTQFNLVQQGNTQNLIKNFYKVFTLDRNTNTTLLAKVMSVLKLTPQLVERLTSTAEQLAVQSDMVIKLSQSCTTRQALLGLSVATFLSFICSASALIVSATRFFLSLRDLRASALYDEAQSKLARSLFYFNDDGPSRLPHRARGTTTAELKIVVPLMFPVVILHKADESK